MAAWRHRGMFGVDCGGTALISCCLGLYCKGGPMDNQNIEDYSNG